MRKRWIQDPVTKQLVEAELYVPPDPVTANVMGDIKPYRSQIDGSVIGSRSTHREHLRQHRCIEVGNEVNALMNPRRAEPDRNVRPELSRAFDEVMRKHR